MKTLTLAGWVLGALLWSACGSDDDDEGACVQVTVFARSATGNCSAYPSTCDVPAGYVECCGGVLGGCVASGPDARCVDDPTDSCSPNTGGADCPGVCD
ncbi:hypothetical protein FJV41_23400 [Myxococcus llanfairpwllgwyngyllgogerychwyrndrobwllllantysiliogogogochensis]|uniref:Lipoprotein n=1 Tax=Myxococcus llanfairpwllgwyngyllgogerychwyrndrobwllllantysiliogogogochensis TaxID=2590453 RepID=A0A540WWZ8_9BACT|nr:hypothetical protein FJV41_23400 [Myxococcus llanfairpwllgwyngyllgogerychwyrndrobwllllantysiliogogogochensis]